MHIFNLPDSSMNNRVFITNGTSNSWQTWIKPPNIKFIHILVVGGGGGGGGGASQTLNISTGGGGGGGSAFSQGYFPAFLIPDLLYIQVGPGGPGGASISAGSAGSLSYVSVQPNTTAQNVILASGAVVAGGGGAGGGSIAGSAGAAGTIFTQATRPASYLGITSFLTGVIGQAGGVGGSPLANLSYTQPFGMGGAGGAGNTVGGSQDTTGNITTGVGSATQYPTISGGTSGGVGTRGGSGYSSILPSSNFSLSIPFFNTAGAAGGNSSSGAGGAGGDGAYGCGGGGGGSSNNSGGGGKGGNGGGGIVIITCY